MKYQQKPGIVCTEVEKQMVLLHPSNGKVIILNEAGTRLWHMLTERQAVDELFCNFTAVYHTTTTAKQEIESFIALLQQKELLDVEA